MNFNLTTYLEELKYLVNIDCGSKTPQGTTVVAKFFDKKYKALGWSVNTHQFHEEIGPCLEITNTKTDAYDVLLIGHMDTVFPEGTVNERAFTIKDNKAYGPGVIDMKASLLSVYYALKTLQEENKLQGASICVALNSDEEISSRHSNLWIQELAKKSKYAFILEPARKNGALVNERKGVGRYFIDFKGVEAHAGIEPEKGRSAIVELAHWITELNDLTNYKVGTTVNVGVVSGGTVANVIAGNAYAEVDIRFKYIKEAERIDDAIKELLANTKITGVEVNVKGGVTRPPMTPSKKTMELCKIITNIGKELGIKIEWVATGGGSDANITAAQNVPTIDGLGPIGGGVHGVGEYLEVDSIEQRGDLLIKALEVVLEK